MTELRQIEKIDPKTEIGTVRLAVKDLPGMKKFYRDMIGLAIINDNQQSVKLGVGDLPLVELISNPDGISHPNSTGLFHIAILLPNRPELGRWLKHFISIGYPLDGVGDHLVSEALYLSDPEGNGIEIYRDRPKETWEYIDGQIQMGTKSVDLESLLEQASPNIFSGLPEGTKMGHIHLQVNNVSKTAAFYQDILGFDLIAKMPGAGFLSAGGYHHHIGMNTWRSMGGGIAPADSLGLVDYQIVLPSSSSQESIANKLSSHEINFSRQNGTLRVQDPAGIWIEFVLREQ